MGRYVIWQGVSLSYYWLKTLPEEIRIAQADDSDPSMVEQLSKVGLLILNDWGIEMLDATERSNLLEIIDNRYGRASTVVASQLPVDKWSVMIDEATFTAAIPDKLIHS